jgi:hypothetical protein
MSFDPETVAADLLARSQQVHPPVDLARVAALWPSLRVSTDDLDGEGYLLDLGSQGAEILVRAADSIARQRYTIAHELGHWILRNQKSPTAGHSSQASRTSLERWCDRFAAALLMPRDWVTADIERSGLKALPGTVLRAPSAYQVSHRALRLRISEVSPISLFEVRQEGRGVVIQHRYHAVSAPVDAVANALRQAIRCIAGHGLPNRLTEHENAFTSLPRLISRRQQQRTWLVLVVPTR